MTKMNFKNVLMIAVAALAMGLFLSACECPPSEPPEPLEEPVPIDLPEEVETLEVPEPGVPIAVPEPEEEAEPEEPEEEEAMHRPYEDSPYAEAIDAGLAFILESANDAGVLCSWPDFARIDFLQRKFDLDPRFSGLELFDVEGLHEDILAVATLHARLVVPDFDLEEAQVPFELVGFFSDYEPPAGQRYITPADLRHIPDDMTNIMLRAMYCDVEPVRETLGSELVRTAVRADYLGEPNNFGGYLALHMILSWQWMRELGCADDMQTLSDVDDTFTEILVEIVEDQGIVTDLGISAVACLYYIGQRAHVQDAWVEAIAEAQTPEGGWDRLAGKGDREQLTCQATAVALWVLLEDALPEVEDIPWIR